VLDVTPTKHQAQARTLLDVSGASTYVENSLFGGKIRKLGLEIQQLTDPQTFEKANLRQDPLLDHCRSVGSEG
jgi:hypothetical protein